jgi:hypothetical protein
MLDMASSRVPVALAAAAALLLTAGACSRSQPPAAQGGAPSAAPAATAPAANVPAAPRPAEMASHAPTAAPVGAAVLPSSAVATGKVLETMDAGGYTYVQLDTPSGKIWAATSQTKVAVGQLLSVPLEMPMQNFHSNALGRDFPLIYFASRVSHGGEPLPPRPAEAAGAPGSAAPPAQAPAATPTQMPAGHPSVGGAASAPVTVTEVIPPPAGGQSIESLWAKRAALAGKRVVVRGKVVKFLGGIMGHNWAHLQDGTGASKDGTHDITITTDATVKPGDVVTATGTLAVDKDFGAGYKYGAIVEGATITP